MKFSIKYFFSKYDQIHNFLRIWSHLLKKSLIETIIFFAILPAKKLEYFGWNDIVNLAQNSIFDIFLLLKINIEEEKLRLELPELYVVLLPKC